MTIIISAIIILSDKVCDQMLFNEAISEGVCDERLMRMPVTKINKMLMFAKGTKRLLKAPIKGPGCSKILLALGSATNRIKNIPSPQLTTTF